MVCGIAPASSSVAITPGNGGLLLADRDVDAVDGDTSCRRPLSRSIEPGLADDRVDAVVVLPVARSPMINSRCPGRSGSSRRWR